ncbi:DUF5304 domain-containing protein [Streptomyces sp. NPDC001941]|uniref:DUF5304 domain-containing protein n=1 Tax=Streptomyces sp. NPDC001941 TaxID=3154659 RepID=UPI003324EFAF
MSDATERPPYDADAWAKACAEDLAAEKARRRAERGPQPGSAAEELRKLVDAVAEKVAGFQSGLPGMAAQGAVNQLIDQARSAGERVIERNPQVFDHLAAAGSELLAAYRSAVEGQEKRWTHDRPGTGEGSEGWSKGRDEGPAAGEQIDLD